MPTCPPPEEFYKEDDNYDIPNETNGKGEEMTSIRAKIYHEELQRGCLAVS